MIDRLDNDRLEGAFARVAVLMPAYNAAKYIRTAIDSVLAQTFTDFELLIINDGSTDVTGDIIDSYDDPRIRHVINPHNMGLIASLNRGLELAQGKYIARLDADDISLPHRLEEQVAYMDTHQDVGLLASNTLMIDEQGNLISPDPQLPGEVSPDYLQWLLIQRNPITHSSIMLRHDLLTRHQLTYDVAFFACEDYDLWLRISHLAKIAFYPAVLVHYRLVPTGVNATQRYKQTSNVQKLLQRELTRFIQQHDHDVTTTPLSEAKSAGISTLAAYLAHAAISDNKPTLTTHSVDVDYIQAAWTLMHITSIFLRRQLSTTDRAVIKTESLKHLSTLARLARAQSAQNGMIVTAQRAWASFIYDDRALVNRISARIMHNMAKLFGRRSTHNGRTV